MGGDVPLSRVQDTFMTNGNLFEEGMDVVIGGEPITVKIVDIKKGTGT
jgi:hypothetical protein